MNSIRSIILLLLIAPLALAAQTKNPADIETDLPPRGSAIPIADNGYDGTLASMACLTVPVTTTGSIENVSVEVAMEHTFVGDLTVKVVSPASTVATVLSRPGLDETVDDGSGCCGGAANLVIGSPITYVSSSVNDAELISDGLVTDDVVCQDNGVCDYFPNPGSASDSGDLATIFDGEEASGDWQVCVGDSFAFDTGNLDAASVTVDVAQVIPESRPVPTLNWIGMFVLMLVIAGLGMALLRRRQEI